MKIELELIEDTGEWIGTCKDESGGGCVVSSDSAESCLAEIKKSLTVHKAFKSLVKLSKGHG